MKKVLLSPSPNQPWFDPDTAQVYYSKIKGDHLHCLYHTRKGNWVLLDQKQTFNRIQTEGEARAWLAKYWLDDPTIKSNSGEL